MRNVNIPEHPHELTDAQIATLVRISHGLLSGARTRGFYTKVLEPLHGARLYDVVEHEIVPQRVLTEKGKRWLDVILCGS